jgi:hypothetical protein
MPRLFYLKGLEDCLSKQVDIGSFNKLRRLDAELGHKGVGFLDTGLGRFIFIENDLKFQKMTKPFHPVEVHPGSPNQVQGAMLQNSAGLAVG